MNSLAGGEESLEIYSVVQMRQRKTLLQELPRFQLNL